MTATSGAQPPVGVSEGPSAGETAEAPTGDFRALERELAAVIDPAAFDRTASITPGRRADRCADALNAAAAVLMAGYRRVSEDDIAPGVGSDEGCLCHGCGCRYRVDLNIPDALWREIGMSGEGGLLCPRCITGRIEARGVYAAYALIDLVSEDDDIAAHHRDRCPHCAVRAGACARCGLRDAEAWELCGPCDREVEAEAAALRGGGHA